MTLTGAKVTEINKAYLQNVNLSNKRRDALKISVGSDDQWSDKVYCGNWMVCRIDDLADMITALQDMKQTIEDDVLNVLSDWVDPSNVDDKCCADWSVKEVISRISGRGLLRCVE